MRDNGRAELEHHSAHLEITSLVFDGSLADDECDFVLPNYLEVVTGRGSRTGEFVVLTLKITTFLLLRIQSMCSTTCELVVLSWTTLSVLEFASLVHLSWNLGWRCMTVQFKPPSSLRQIRETLSIPFSIHYIILPPFLFPCSHNDIIIIIPTIPYPRFNPTTFIFFLQPIQVSCPTISAPSNSNDGFSKTTIFGISSMNNLAGKRRL